MADASFTIAVPTHNRRDTVLLAVRSALAQELAPEQVIVLCDGCTDGTASALRALGDERVVVLELDKGPGYAYDHRNRALERTTSAFIVYLGDDDLLLPDHLARIAERAGGVDLVCTPAVIVEPDDELRWIGADWSVPEARERMEMLANSNVMASVAIRVDRARVVGGWDGTVEKAADWDLWRRATHAGATAVATDQPTVLHFKATGREQQWSDRVAQNRRWLDVIEDPQQLAALRPRLAQERYRHEARTDAELDQCRVTLEEYGAELTRLHRLHAEQHAALTAARDQIAERELALADALRLSEARLEWITRSEALLAVRQEHIDAAERELAELREGVAGHGRSGRLRRRASP